MPPQPVSRALQQFVDDEMLRAPLLFDQVVEGTLAYARKAMAMMSPVDRATASEMLQALTVQHSAAAQAFMQSLRQQVAGLLNKAAPVPTPARREPQPLTLVDDAVVALEVELSHTIQGIKDAAEYELMELKTYTAALVGDMHMTADHNPLGAEVYARALWAASQTLQQRASMPLAFMRHASPPLAQLLRRSWAAACSRLEALGIEPASYRTVVLSSGSSRTWRSDGVQATDWVTGRPILPVPLDLQPGQARRDAPAGSAAPRQAMPPLALVSAPERPPASERASSAPAQAQRDVAKTGSAPTWHDGAREAGSPAERQAVELASRLFDALMQDERLPQDVGLLVSRLQGPTVRLALVDPGLLEQRDHPLWCFINRLAFAAEMSPDPGNPERQRLMKVVQATVDQLAREPQQSSTLYRWALERLDSQLALKTQHRIATLSSRIGVLQKLEDQLAAKQLQPPITLQGTLDVPQLDTVPATLLDESATTTDGRPPPDEWIGQLRSGDWLRLVLQGRWMRAQLLWTGERRDIWLLGDGASEATWAVRRSAMVTLYQRGLLKSLVQRSIVAAAAARVRDQLQSSRRAGTA